MLPLSVEQLALLFCDFDDLLALCQTSKAMRRLTTSMWEQGRSVDLSGDVTEVRISSCLLAAHFHAGVFHQMVNFKVATTAVAEGRDGQPP